MITIVDYGMGNVGSIRSMARKVGAEVEIVNRPDQVAQAEKLVLPGVGAFDAAMKRLEELDLIPVLTERVIDGGVPILGVCLGMQLFCQKSEEGTLPGLGWVKALVRRFDFTDEPEPIRIPHMGWNRIEVVGPDPSILANQPESSRFYFTHSYAVHCENESDVLGITNYGRPFHSAIKVDNIIGMQCHPEKSHRYGKEVLTHFAAL